MRIWLVPWPAGAPSRWGSSRERGSPRRDESAPVSGVARCACPFDIMRTAMSMSAGKLAPDSTLIATGGATKATNGSAEVACLSRSGAIPINRCRARMASSLSAASALCSISVRQLGRGGRRIASAGNEHARVGCRLMLAAGTRPEPSTSSMSAALPVGSSCSGLGAAGSSELEPDGAPVPADAVERHVAGDRGLLAIHAEARDDDLLRVGVVDAHGPPRPSRGLGTRPPSTSRTGRSPTTCSRSCRCSRHAPCRSAPARTCSRRRHRAMRSAAPTTHTLTGTTRRRPCR